MYISYILSATAGFKKWSLEQSEPNNDNDRPGGGKPAAVTAPLVAEPAAKELRAVAF
jgi:hypothetical protein